MNSAKNEQGAKARELDARLRARVLLARAVADDRLMLADSTLLAALDGRRVLTPNERQALTASPLTLRRFRQLAGERQAAARAPAPLFAGAANDAQWSGSSGMLRAAASAATLASLTTDDNCWTLDFLPHEGGWKIILSLAANAPFAARLLNELPLLRVIDGGGAILLQGRLDADGECECQWPFSSAPAEHFQMYGASFVVQPVAP